MQTHGQNTENAPVEETELNYPIRILRYELVDYSDGAGTHRAPVRRDPQCALGDVRDGKVSVERALNVYRVGLDSPRWLVDEPETRRLRQGEAR